MALSRSSRSNKCIQNSIVFASADNVFSNKRMDENMNRIEYDRSAMQTNESGIYVYSMEIGLAIGSFPQ